MGLGWSLEEDFQQVISAALCCVTAILEPTQYNFFLQQLA